MKIDFEKNVVSISRGEGKEIIRLPKTENQEYRIETPDPHLARVWVYENASEFLISLSEADIAKALFDERKQIERVFDAGLVGVKLTLAQTPLAPTIMQGVCGLPGQVSMRVGTSLSLTDGLENIKPKIAPVSTTPDELIDYLIEKYRAKLSNAETAIVLFSGGWDSRLELALVRESLPKAARIVLAHVRTNSHELETVQSIAMKIRATLVVADADKLLQTGMAWPSMMSRARSESTWRPTVPIYGALMAVLKAQLKNSVVFGFCPFPLKGRDYDRIIDTQAPTWSRVRIIKPEKQVLEMLGCRSEHYSEVQQRVWTSLLSGTQDWTTDQRQDWLNWNGYYANGYAHRVRTLHTIAIDPIYAHNDVVSRFMGLSENCKRGTAFIDYALKRIAPDFEDLPILASTGDISRGTEFDGGSFSDAATNNSPEGMFSVLNRVPEDQYEPEFLADPLQYRMLVLKTLIRSEGEHGNFVDQILKVGDEFGGAFGINAAQVADFIISTTRKRV